MKRLLDALLDGRELAEQEAAALMETWADGGLDPIVAGAVLAAFRVRGVTPSEVRGFAKTLRRWAVRPPIDEGGPPLVDTCGTGGDGSHSLNLSTGAALLAAAAGARVVKHGNRAVSSASGSADVLGFLGVKAPLVDDPFQEAEAAAELLARTGFTFLFAPRYHPAMAHVVPVRQALGVRTVFNLLGPLVNPAQPPYQLVGAWSPDAARLMADALAGLGVDRAFVVHGEPGWDEATPVGPFLQVEVREGEVEERMVDPADHGIPRCGPEELAGGEPAYNARRLRAVLEGREEGAHRNALCLSAGLALQACGLADDLRGGIDRAAQAISDGAGTALLEKLGG
ncbi:MAG: anthranilate phosphoribosyltransferase [Alphaproteobacteria bacterium]|nr:anthranilate phosphoribosyltransferase [Alphaproteobacteria bacterium]